MIHQQILAILHDRMPIVIKPELAMMVMISRTHPIELPFLLVTLIKEIWFNFFIVSCRNAQNSFG